MPMYVYVSTIGLDLFRISCDLKAKCKSLARVATYIHMYVHIDH